MQAQGDIAHRADVDRDVLAGGAVAAGGGLHEHAVFEAQADGQAVVFQFGRVQHLVGVEPFAHAAVEIDHIVFAEAVIQGQHRHRVGDLPEFGNWRGAHAKGGRIVGDRFRMQGLERLQFAEQAVVFGVRDGGRILDVVTVDMLIEFGRQCGHPFQIGRVGRCTHGVPQLNRRSARVEPAGMSAAAISS